MLNFSIAISPAMSVLQGQLSRFVGQIRSTRVPMEQAVRDVISPRIISNFENTVDASTGRQWASLKEVTYQMPLRRYMADGGGPSLQVTGTLYREATDLRTWVFDGQAGVAYANMARVPYALAQHEGTTSPLTGGDVPGRPFMTINDSDMDRIAEIFSEWIGDRLDRTVASGVQSKGSAVSTSSYVEVNQALENYLNEHKEVLGIHDVWYGDEDLIPKTPAISIVPGGKTRVLAETGLMTMNEFRTVLMVFHSRMDAPGVTRKECDVLAEQVEALLHANTRLDGLLIHSHVESVEPGVARRQRVVMRATQIVWVGRTKTRL